MEKTGLKLIDMDDAALAALATAGEQMAFLILYDRYKRGVQMHVAKYVAVREDIEDIVLVSFQKAFLQIASYNPQFSFSTWIYRIARNTAFDHLQKSSRCPSPSQTESIDDETSGISQIPATTPNPEDEVIRGQEYGKLLDAINGLSPTYRKVAQMVLLENYGYQEVADTLNLPLNTVKTRVKRAKENLLKIFSN